MRIFRFIYIAVASFVLVYISLSLSGIFFIAAPDFRAVLYSMPLNVCSLVILLSMTVELFLGSAQSGRAGIAGWIALVDRCNKKGQLIEEWGFENPPADFVYAPGCNKR